MFLGLFAKTGGVLTDFGQRQVMMVYNFAVLKFLGSSTLNHCLPMWAKFWETGRIVEFSLPVLMYLLPRLFGGLGL